MANKYIKMANKYIKNDCSSVCFRTKLQSFFTFVICFLIFTLQQRLLLLLLLRK